MSLRGLQRPRKVPQHIRSLARTSHGPHATSLRKAITTCVLPSLLYGTGCWYGGHTKTSRISRADRVSEVSARLGWHVATIDKIVALAARGMLSGWRRVPTSILFRDAGVPRAHVALEGAKLRFALRLRTVDVGNPLAARLTPQTRQRG
jgi:hypothetical protein